MSNVNLTAQLSGPNEITISGFYGRSVVVNEKVVEMIEKVQNESKEILSYLTEALDLFITSIARTSSFVDAISLWLRSLSLRTLKVLRFRVRTKKMFANHETTSAPHGRSSPWYSRMAILHQAYCSGGLCKI